MAKDNSKQGDSKGGGSNLEKGLSSQESFQANGRQADDANGQRPGKKESEKVGQFTFK